MTVSPSGFSDRPIFWVSCVPHDTYYPYGSKAEILLFSEGSAGHNTLSKLSWFNVVYADCDHGRPPHIFTLGLFQKGRDLCFSKEWVLRYV